MRGDYTRGSWMRWTTVDCAAARGVTVNSDKARGPRRQPSLTALSRSGIVTSVTAAEPPTTSNGASSSRRSGIWRWLRPGLGVKRWFVMMVLGMTLIGLGLNTMHPRRTREAVATGIEFAWGSGPRICSKR